MAIALKPFDPSRDFVAQTNFRADGVIWLRKEPFDKSRVNDRVLRQLYEARKIGYDESGKAQPVVSGHPPLDPVAQHETALVAEGAIEPETTEDAADGGAAPAEGEAAAAPDGEAGTAAADPLDHDRNGEKGGSLPDNTGDRDTLIKRLAKRHNHDQLFAKASGIKGVTKDMTKAEIAAALVDAGRAGDEPA